jgi:uncharacterized repeat protein (TIGR01451 family)
MPLGRIMAAMMLASLISTLFAIPAWAAPVDVRVGIASAPAAGSNVKTAVSNVVYTITVTNNDPVGASGVVTLMDDVGTGTYVTNDQLAACASYVAPILTCTIPPIAISGAFVVNVTVTAGVVGALINAPLVAMAGDSNGANNTASNTTNSVATLADVTIAKSHSASATTPGTDVTYTLAVSNAGPDTATGVSVSDILPAGLTFKSSASGCTAAAPPVVTCAVSSVAMGTPQSVSFIATIGSVPSGTVIANTATIPPITTPESNTNNNTSPPDSLTVSAASVDLGVTFAVAPTTAAPGNKVTYTATVTNPNTTTDATNVVVTDALPTGLTPVTPPAAPSSGTVAVAGSTWTWTIPTVAKATSATTPTVVTASFDAIVDPATTLTTITNTATMTATQTDPVSTNNTASVDLTITPAVADLNVLTAVDNAKPNKGDQIAIAIQVSNAGPDDATNVVVKDVLPNGLKYDSCTPCGPSSLKRSTSQQFSIASIPADSVATIILNVTVQASSGTLQNTASVLSADQSDPNGANDNDTLKITIAGTNNSGTGTGGTGTGTGSGGTAGSGGSTAFTGFTANELLPWLMLFATLGLVALEYARRRPAVAAIGHTYGFDPWV